MLIREITRFGIYTAGADDPRLLAKVDDTTSPNGYIEGYLAVFNNVDQQGDRIIKGAFSKSIAERVSAGKVPLMAVHFAHGGDVKEVIGIITQAKEDDYGLWVHAELSSTPLAQEIRVKVMEGMIWGLSVGYNLLKWQESKVDDRYILDLLECRLVEGTVTVHPANELAVITSAKSVISKLPAGGESPLPQEDVERLRADISKLIQQLESKSSIIPEVPPAPTGFNANELDLMLQQCMLADAELSIVTVAQEY